MPAPLQYRLSDSIQRLFPDLLETLVRTHLAAIELDDDVPQQDVWVIVRRSRSPQRWSGWAFPHVASYTQGRQGYLRGRGQRIQHENGLITMRLGSQVSLVSAARLYAHELRHLAQYARGRRETGYLQIVGMESRQYERDCRIFEGQVLKRMGLDAQDDFAWRNQGYQARPRSWSQAA